MTGVIGTIDMSIRGLATGMAFTDYICTYSLTQPVIKYKVFAYELTIQPFLPHFPGIVDDSAIELVYIFEAMIL